MKTVLQLALTLLISALLFAACAPVFAQDATVANSATVQKDKAAVTTKKDDSIPLPADKAKALDEVKTAFEKAQKDAELAQAKLDAAKANLEKAQMQFVLIVEMAKREVKCDDCQLTEDGKSLRKPEKTAQAKP
jgi:ABC-type glycerol-3-phosphate transport system substrate-binding protein